MDKVQKPSNSERALRFRVLGNRVLSGIFGPKREEGTGGEF
jgi:hypothetical protein